MVIHLGAILRLSSRWRCSHYSHLADGKKTQGRIEEGSDLFKVTPANERESLKEDPVQKT